MKIVNPAISVIMPVYNSERFLEESISSILNQTFSDFEFIIINDGSTDSSNSIIQGFCALDDRIVFVNQSNVGLTKSLNVGVGLAKGKYIARQDADDISLPERFEKQIDIIKNHPNTLVYSPIQILDEHGDVLCNIYPARDAIKYFMKMINPVAHGSIMLSRKSLLSAGGYCPDVYRGQDYELYLRISDKVKFLRTDTPQYQLRIHDQCMSNEICTQLFNSIPRATYNKAALAAYRDKYRDPYNKYLTDALNDRKGKLQIFPPVEYLHSLYLLIGQQKRKSIAKGLLALRKKPTYWKQIVILGLSVLPSFFSKPIISRTFTYLMDK